MAANARTSGVKTVPDDPSLVYVNGIDTESGITPFRRGRSMSSRSKCSIAAGLATSPIACGHTEIVRGAFWHGPDQPWGSWLGHHHS
jgi:hypothetical protein